MRDAPPVPAVGASPVVGERGRVLPADLPLEDTLKTARRGCHLDKKTSKKLTKNPKKVENCGPSKVWEAACHAGSRGVANAIHAVEKLQYKMQATPQKHAYTDCNTSTPAKTRQPSQMPVPVRTAHLFPLSAMGIAAAEREGFEPSVTSLPRSISSRVP